MIIEVVYYLSSAKIIQIRELTDLLFPFFMQKQQTQIQKKQKRVCHALMTHPLSPYYIYNLNYILLSLSGSSFLAV